MRILHYNILDGCQGEPARLAGLGGWLTDQAFDFVGLNELNGWNVSPGISELSSDWGYPHHALLETTRRPYFVGAISRHPIQRIATFEKGFHHGMLVLDVMGIHVVITHLTPVSADDREREAARIVEILEEVDGPVLLMGDLNTLSPEDRDRHMASDLAGSLRQNAHLARKFLDAQGEINYRPMQILLDAGLVDLSRSQDPTVPTAANTDAAHAAPMRLDYIMGNRQLLSDKAPVAETLYEDPLPQLSDHFPVACTW
ncbi:MAG TPA: endonuclease/exonuclease/phosphatase family protein [Thermomicrobiales bacterium]|nr:endonuclease/exonuclease/phosphatase family protein [Thermomicrobiales bacterium]